MDYLAVGNLLVRLDRKMPGGAFAYLPADQLGQVLKAYRLIPEI